MFDVVGGISSAIAIVRQVRQAASAIKSSEIDLKMAELLELLGESKLRCFELLTENLEIKQKLAEAIEVRSTTPEYRDGSYFFDGAGPCCTACWDGRSTKARLAKTEDNYRMMTGMQYRCPVCKSVYG